MEHHPHSESCWSRHCGVCVCVVFLFVCLFVCLFLRLLCFIPLIVCVVDGRFCFVVFCLFVFCFVFLHLASSCLVAESKGGNTRVG
jgi:hypothetical protein